MEDEPFPFFCYFQKHACIQLLCNVVQTPLRSAPFDVVKTVCQHTPLEWTYIRKCWDMALLSVLSVDL